MSNEILSLESKIEGLLFYKGEQVAIKKLAELLNVSNEEVSMGLDNLQKSLIGRGLVLVRNEEEVVLGITGELSSLIESIRKEEITKELSKSALDTLSIVIYLNGVSRSEIDYIRGVNSSFILRNLSLRGLVEKYVDENDTRKVLYKPSLEALQYMNVSSIDQIPNYAEIHKQLEETLHQKINNE